MILVLRVSKVCPCWLFIIQESLAESICLLGWRKTDCKAGIKRDCAVLLYNALTANNASGSAYGTTLGFTVSNGQVDGSTILLSSLEGQQNLLKINLSLVFLVLSMKVDMESMNNR